MTSQLLKKERKYTLIKFVYEDEQSKNEKSEIETVPNTWIGFDLTRHQLISKFMPPPYTSKRLKVLREIVKQCKEPISDWPSYDIDIRGYAKSYEEAEVQIRKLTVQPYCFTTDENETPSAISERIKKMHESQKSETLPKKDAEDLLKISSLDEEVSDDESNSCNQSKTSEGGQFSEQSSFSGQDTEVVRVEKEIAQKSQSSRLEFLDPHSKTKFYSMPSEGQEDLNPDAAKKTPLAAKSTEKKTEKVTQANSTSNKKKGENSVSKNLKPSKNNQQFVNNSSLSQDLEILDELKSSNLDSTNKKSSGQRAKGNEGKSKQSTNLISKNKEKEDIPLSLFEILMDFLTRLESDIRQIKRDIAHLKSMIEAINGTKNVQAESLAERHGLDLPLKTESDFQKLENCLESNSFSKEFKQSLLMLIDHDNVLSKTITNILRKYLSRDVAMSYVATKRTEGKKLFKPTIFCKKMHDVIASKMETERKEFTDRAFYRALGVVLTNSKDWKGHRQLRKKVIAELEIPVLNPEDLLNREP
ncbi:uncharacterized protein LOC127280265 isoform X2 [Leptopilina boulardi]|uniref:uncharacterized protein LOC127280265 isoform X2 n=1 Tax=Leptopilina boulardi TaxID=63433 RepID=UPI0021F60AA7|nr:uncharacterized protein LOC127280265 isoform X2 [Leptopilina boulardi]